jgi:hypothetical protein
MDKTNRNFEGRVLIANRKIADDFVKALKIRKGEVVIEAFPGPGLLTRSLLNGGSPEDIDMKEETRDVGEKPAIVVACEPSPSLLVQGLGMGDGDLPGEIPARFESEDYAIYQSKIHQSNHEPRLLLSPSTPYRWPTLSQLIANPLVNRYIPKFISRTAEEKLSEEEEEVGKRPWNAAEPPITIVAQMPQSVAGDQMVAQWIGSCAGTGVKDRTWIWQWGRIRLALLVGKNQYDVSPFKSVQAINNLINSD